MLGRYDGWMGQMRRLTIFQPFADMRLRDQRQPLHENPRHGEHGRQDLMLTAVVQPLTLSRPVNGILVRLLSPFGSGGFHALFVD